MSLGERGWFFPSWTARKYHFDDGEGISLCRKWRRINALTGHEQPVEAQPDAAASTSDCVACRRKLEAQ